MAKHTKSRSFQMTCRSCGNEFTTGSSIKFHCSVECRLKDLATPYAGVDACWNWTGSINPKTGYGQLSSWENGKRMLYTAHRVSFRAYIGEIPAGLVVCHKCDNRKCFNPDHLFTGTQLDNLLDCKNKGRRVDAKKPYSEWKEATPFVRMSGVNHPMWGKTNKQGVDHHGAKLTDSDVLEIRASCETLKIISERYGISQSTASSVKRRKTWAHVL